MDFLSFASLRYSIRLSIKILSSHRIFQERCPINKNKKTISWRKFPYTCARKGPSKRFLFETSCRTRTAVFLLLPRGFFVFLSQATQQQRKEIHTPRKIVQDTLKSFLYQGVVLARLFLFKIFISSPVPRDLCTFEINNKKTDALDCETSSISTSFVTFDRTNKYPSIPGMMERVRRKGPGRVFRFS